MGTSTRRPLLVAVVGLALSLPGAELPAQQRPSTADARQLLQARPDLVEQLRQRIRVSGLTSEQVRARLRAEGYPESLLDGYMREGSDSVPPSEDVFAAVRDLGIADSADVAMLRGAGQSGHAMGLPSRVPPGAAAADGDTARLEALGATADSGFAVFGLDVFRENTSRFDPNTAGPVDAGYRLGPGDHLVLILTGDVELAHTLDVTREGFVVIPQVGQLHVANLTLGQLEDVLYSRLGRVYSGVRRGGGATTRFSISVARLRSNQVFVVGDVALPGSYRVSSAGTALSALYAAGGPTANGSMRRIEVRRGGRRVDELDVYDYLLRGDASHDARLETGDVVFVPVRGPRVRVIGEVVRPATYEMKAGETLADALRAAGGFTPEAARRRVQIERILPPAARGAGGRDRIMLDIASDVLGSDYGPAVPVEPGDVIRVFAVSEAVRDRVVVLGNVWAPGAIGFRQGMTLGEALRAAGGVKADTYLGQVLVTRTNPDSTREQLRATLRDSTGAPLVDVPLRESDEIEVFSVSEFRPARYITISGAVTKGGRFAYRDGMTLRDLVLLARGLDESAFLSEAEIARLPEHRDNGTIATTIRIRLDSSYVFERSGNSVFESRPGEGEANGSVATPEVRLQPYDHVLILRQPDWSLQRTITLTGEVRYPGRYSLVNKSERLTEVLARAGGLSQEANADAVFLYRKASRVGRIGIDLPKALRNTENVDNLVLEDGDSIHIASYTGVVTVSGEVNSPVAVAYARGADLDHYVRAAGGPAQQADLHRAYVVQPNGKVESVRRRPFLLDGVPTPRAGSTIVIPARDPTEKRDYVAAAGAIAQVLASIVALVVVITR